MPKSVDESIELKMQNLKGDLKKITKEAKSEVASDSNLTLEQQRGVKSLVRRVKEEEIIGISILILINEHSVILSF